MALWLIRVPMTQGFALGWDVAAPSALKNN
jgi:hypothetical protein